MGIDSLLSKSKAQVNRHAQGPSTEGQVGSVGIAMEQTHWWLLCVFLKPFLYDLQPFTRMGIY